MPYQQPMRLSGVTKSPIWGGRRLIADWGREAASGTVGESWELTVRREEQSVIVSGAWSGRLLGEVLSEMPEAMLGGTRGGRENFPLLVKLIDAADRLSVQVHPDDDYAARVEQDRGKSELWYIIEAEPGAEIVCGLVPGATAEDFARSVREGEAERYLRHCPVHAGETYFIPAGCPHAIGRGILLAEIQQNCDLTYRVYDYGRRQADGTLRELQPEKALEVVRPFSEGEIDAIRYSRGIPSDRDRVSADCEEFRVEHLRFADGEALPGADYLRHLLMLSGEGALIFEGGRLPYHRGDSILLPAALGGVVWEGSGEGLLTLAY